MKLFTLALVGALALPSHASEMQVAAQYADALRADAPPDVCIAIAAFNRQRSEQHIAGQCASDSLFQIGSITKTFTGLLLSDATIRGPLTLEAPIEQLLNSDASGGSTHPIQLKHLSTHTSGLPRLPDNIDLSPEQMNDPYATYDEALLLDFLASHELTHQPGVHHEYSNLATGLLGFLLASNAGTSYGAMVQDVIAEPLGLHNTTQWPSDEQSSRVLSSHSVVGFKPIPNWTFDTLAGAGALYSTLDDMTSYIRANLDHRSPLTEAFALAHQQHAEMPAVNGAIGLGWIREEIGGEMALWHNGGTAGQRSFTGFVPKTGQGVVVLANANFEEVDAIGRSLLGGDALPSIASETAAEDSPFAEYVGHYSFSPTFAIAITSNGKTLFGQATAQPRFRLRKAKGQVKGKSDRFRVSGVDAQIEFSRNDDAEITGLTLYQNGAELRARKAGAAEEHDVVTLDESTLERYVGQYTLAPDMIITVTRNDTQLLAQLTGQAAFPIYPRSETQFFYRVVQAELEFHVNGEETTALTLHQNGEHRALKNP